MTFGCIFWGTMNFGSIGSRSFLGLDSPLFSTIILFKTGSVFPEILEIF